MSESQSSQVFMFDNSDPEMQRAYEAARLTFPYFWREVAWERRRIIPGLDLACVKAAFSDGQKEHSDGAPSTEHMWFSDIDFDGECVDGVLVNSPNWVKSVKKGGFRPRPAQRDKGLDVRHQRSRVWRLLGQPDAIPNGSAGAARARRRLGAKLWRPKQNPRD